MTSNGHIFCRKYMYQHAVEHTTENIRLFSKQNNKKNKKKIQYIYSFTTVVRVATDRNLRLL